jgi:hypothetical protein
MAFGYTCDWCKCAGKSVSADQRDLHPLPKGWAKISHREHVCGECLERGRRAAQKGAGAVKIYPEGAR